MTEYLIHVWRWRGRRGAYHNPAVIYGPEGSVYMDGHACERLFGTRTPRVGIYGLWVAPAVEGCTDPSVELLRHRARCVRAWAPFSLRFPDGGCITLFTTCAHRLGLEEPGVYNYRLARLHPGWVREQNSTEV